MRLLMRAQGPTGSIEIALPGASTPAFTPIFVTTSEPALTDFAPYNRSMDISSRHLSWRCAALVSLGLGLVGCKDNYEMVTVALESATAEETDTMLTTDATASATEGTSAGTTSASTEGTMSSTASTATTGMTSVGETTGEPAPCDTAPDCTALGDADGDPGPTDVPFFRGRACVVKEAKPGQKIPIRLEACVHPCLSVNAFAYRHAYRCPDGCEVTAALWYADVVGAGCPSDVFAKFDPALCKTLGGVDILAGPIDVGGTPYEGALPVVIPMLTNAQASEIKGGADSSSEIWARVDQNEQSADRTFTVTLGPAAADAPASCAGSELCECRDVGF